MIEFRCPCGKALHAREEYVGQTTRCPQCGRDLAIPAQQGVQAQPPADAPAEPPRRPPYGDDRGWAGRPPATATSGQALAGMILGLASLVGTLFTGIPAVILGALGLRAVSRSEGKLRGKGFAITGLVGGGVGILLFLPFLLFVGIPVWQRLSEGPNKRIESNDLKQINLAMINYSDANNSMPAAAICDPSGKPLLSWRVTILPYIEQQNLYMQFHLNEPWDSPNNLPLVKMMPKVYALPGDSSAPQGHTYFRVFVGDHAAFPPPRPTPVGGMTQGRRYPVEFTNGTSNTVLAAEAATAVPWTKPDELPYDPNAPLPPLGGHYADGFLVGMGDGSVHFVPRGVTERTLRSVIEIDNRVPVGPDWESR